MKRGLFAAAFLAAACLTPVPVFAAEDDISQSVTSDASSDVIIKGQSSVFSVTVPKDIRGSGKSGTLTYYVTIEGDVAGTESVSVVPDKSVTLSQRRKLSRVASISQDRVRWAADEFDEIGTGIITYSDLSTGAYSGTFNFNIEITDHHEHIYNSSVITSPTCELPGEVRYTCVDGDDSYTESVPALGHDYSQVTGKTEATCTTAGYGYSSCSRCGALNPDSSSIIRVEPLGHDFEDKIVAPTCTENGYTVHSCKRCDYSYTSDETQALGHVYKQISSTKFDCNTKGSVTYKCGTCGAESTIYTEVGEHTWNQGLETLPTCTESGKITYTCLVCGETKTEVGQPAKGHNYDDGTVTVPATCETYGTKVYTCYDCGHTKSEQIEMYGHMYYGDTYICSICGESIIWNFEIDESTKHMKLLSMKDEDMATRTRVTIPSKVMIDDVLYTIEFAKSSYTKLVKDENGFIVPSGAKGPFVGNTVIEHVLFEDGSVVEDNDMSCMFLACSSLKSVENIPDSVENMTLTFEYCTALESIPKLPANLVKLVDTFKFDTGLGDVGTVEIPAGVRSMAGAFHTCTNMKGTIKVYAQNIDTVVPSNSKQPFSPCYRTFYKTGAEAGEKAVRVYVYKYKSEDAYNARSADAFNTTDLDLYTSTYKNLYYQTKAAVCYYYTDNTYTVRSDVQTSYKAACSSAELYTDNWFWRYATPTTYSLMRGISLLSMDGDMSDMPSRDLVPVEILEEVPEDDEADIGLFIN